MGLPRSGRRSGSFVGADDTGHLRRRRRGWIQTPGVRRPCVSVLQRTPGKEGLVLALGGGTVTSREALDCLKGRATVVYLEVDAESAWRRVCRSDRPLARDRQAFAGLLDERRAIYETAADVRRRHATEERRHHSPGSGGHRWATVARRPRVTSRDLGTHPGENRTPVARGGRSRAHSRSWRPTPPRRRKGARAC